MEIEGLADNCDLNERRSNLQRVEKVARKKEEHQE